MKHWPGTGVVQYTPLYLVHNQVLQRSSVHTPAVVELYRLYKAMYTIVEDDIPQFHDSSPSSVESYQERRRRTFMSSPSCYFRALWLVEYDALVQGSSQAPWLVDYGAFVWPSLSEAVSGGWRRPSRHPLSVSVGGDATPWPFKEVSTPLNVEGNQTCV